MSPQGVMTREKASYSPGLNHVKGRRLVYIQNLIPQLHNQQQKITYNKSKRDALFLKFILVKNSTCFRQIYHPSSGVLILYSQQ